MSNNHSSVRRRIALLGAAAVAAGGIGLVSTPAFAAQEKPGDGGQGSITVYKLEQPKADNLGENDGTEVDITGAKPLKAGFKACSIDEIGVGDWDRLANITVTLDTGGQPVVLEAGNATPLELSCGAQQMTDSVTGATTFAGLDADKAYVVYESAAAANAVALAQPAVVTVPYPGNGKEGVPTWNYHPVIYPKNTIVGSGATKNGTIVGHDVTYDITVPIQRLPDGKEYSEFRINDQLSGGLTYTGGSVVLKSAGGDSMTLTASEDYTLPTPSGNGGDEVVLKLTPKGLDLLDGNLNGELVFTITAKASGTGDTYNRAQITINGKSTDGGTGPETPVTEKFFSGVHIMKEARNKGADSNVALAGAHFDVYVADNGATACTQEPADDAVPVLEDQISQADGTTPGAVLAEGKYCVYETVTPAGYKGLKGGVLLDVTREGSSVTVVNEQIGSAEGDLPALPLTGGSGTVVLLSLGAGLIAVGVGACILLRRRREQEQDA